MKPYNFIELSDSHYGIVVTTSVSKVRVEGREIFYTCHEKELSIKFPIRCRMIFLGNGNKLNEEQKPWLEKFVIGKKARIPIDPALVLFFKIELPEPPVRREAPKKTAIVRKINPDKHICRKRVYATKREAIEIINIANKDQRFDLKRVYYCPPCQAWHTTCWTEEEAVTKMPKYLLAK